MPPGSQGVSAPRWSPDSQRLVYIAQQDSATVHELYTVFRDGTGNLKVSQLLAGTFMTNSFANVGWSPDGTRIAYVAVQDPSGRQELFTVKPDGTSNARVNTALSSGSVNPNLLQFPSGGWSPDSTKLIYVVQGVPEHELFIGNADGSGAMKLSGTMASGAQVRQYIWAPDGSRIAFQANAEQLGIYEISQFFPTAPGASSRSPRQWSRGVAPVTAAWASSSGPGRANDSATWALQPLLG